jgi:RHS repeat-associated protein
MNKFLPIFLCLQFFLTITVYSQTNIPTGVTSPAAATARPLPNIYSATPIDYIRTYSPNKPIQDTSLISMNALVEDVGISTQYKDSYGRPVQVVNRQTSPGKNDMVAPAFYDEFGRSSITYLPFSAMSGNSNDGRFKINAFAQDSAFYKSLNPNESINYGQELYDGSPLNMTIKTMAPGNNWGGAGIGNNLSHRTNTISDSVRLWTINVSGEDDLPITSTFYQPGTLTVVQMIDEQGIVSIKYIDNFGRAVLTKNQLASSPSTGFGGWLCTYNIFDEMNHLRMVIPPKAVIALNNTSTNWSLTLDTTINKNLCYAYYYDARGRITMRRIPGKGKIYQAYDLFDRVVMTQDPNLRIGNQWAYILYDGQSRPVKTGLITTSLVKDSVLAQAARSNNYPTLTGSYTVNTETYYDDYNWIAAMGAPVSSTLISTYINGNNFNTNYNTFPDYPQAIINSNRMRGKVTGTKNIILNTSTYLYTVNIYDDHGRVIQNKKTNYTGGADIATLQYGYSGQVLRTHILHQKAGNNAQTHSLLTKYTYDHVGRVKNITKNIDSLGDKLISQESYNEAGQLNSKVIGASTSEIQNYSYNIRGWLTAINQGFVNTANSTANYFGEVLAYDYGFTNKQMNGNISGVQWKGRGDGIARAYGFSYDNNSRLTVADFSQQVSGGPAWSNSNVDFSVNGLSYDAGGNILSLKQRGLKVGASATIDSLSYQYFTNSNQLEKVSDGIIDNSPLGDFKDTTLTGDDYTYDVNGNINKDFNKHICSASGGTGAVFNYLNKPDSIVINGRAGIHYFYDASGMQLAKRVNDYTGASPAIKTYLYIGGFVYLNDTLQYVLQEEGRIRYAQKKNNLTGVIYYAFEYDYFLKDHLGNVRTVLTEGRDTTTYAATMESRDSVTVAALFSNVYTPVNTVFAKPTAFDSDTTNHYVARLNASTGVNKKTGPSLVLKVMAGDQVQINTFAYYNSPVQPPTNGTTLLSDILSLLAGGVVNNSGGKFGAGDISNLTNSLNPNVAQFLNTARNYDTTRPKAYLNWILFDDQFNYVASNSGVQQVLAGGSKQALVAPLQTISKNGYLYVYVSNESPLDVYFDNLTVKYTTGPLIQEQSYYPFGLQMAGISDKALLKQITPYKANGGTELEEDYGLSYYNTSFRKYDPQIGRFTGIDVLTENTANINPYQFGYNNPITYNDPTGAWTSQAFLYNARVHIGQIELGDGSYIGNSWYNDFYNPLTDVSTDDGGYDGGGGGVSTDFSLGPNASFWTKTLSRAFSENGIDRDLSASFSDAIDKYGSPAIRIDYSYGVLNGSGNTLGNVIVGVDIIHPNFLGHLDPGSFQYVPTFSNWQEAAVKNIKLQGRYLGGEMNGQTVNVIIKEALYFGAPIERKTGEKYSDTYAAYMSAKIVDFAGFETLEQFKNHWEWDRDKLQNVFISNIREGMQLILSGTLSRQQGKNAKVKLTVNDADYDWF